MYNQYNIEAKPSSNYLTSILFVFKNYLISEKISGGSIRSYLSDLRHFLGWFIFFLGANKIIPKDSFLIKEGSAPDFFKGNIKGEIRGSLGDNQIIEILKYVNERVLLAYKNYLTDNNVPLKTANRRFSSLRKFGSFCQSQNWVTASPFDALRNISQDQPFPESEYHLGEFKTELWKKGLAKVSLKNYLNDVKQFLSWNKNNF